MSSARSPPHHDRSDAVRMGAEFLAFSRRRMPEVQSSGPLSTVEVFEADELVGVRGEIGMAILAE